MRTHGQALISLFIFPLWVCVQGLLMGSLTAVRKYVLYACLFVWSSWNKLPPVGHEVNVKMCDTLEKWLNNLCYCSTLLTYSHVMVFIGPKKELPSPPVRGQAWSCGALTLASVCTLMSLMTFDLCPCQKILVRSQ